MFVQTSSFIVGILKGVREMFFSPPMKVSFKIFISVLSLLILFSFKSPKNILLTPLIEQIYGMYDEEKLIKGIVDRVEDNEKAVVLIENELKEVIINQTKNKPLKSGDVINLTQVDHTYELVNINEAETLELKIDMDKLLNQLKEDDD